MEFCSQESLQQFLIENATNLSTLSLGEFRIWLEDRIENASRHRLFVERCRARDLRRHYRSSLRSRERRLKQAEQEYRADPVSQTLEELRERVRDLTNAVEELSRAVAESRAHPTKLAEFETRRISAIRKFEHLENTTPTRQRLKDAQQSLADFQEQIGLTQIERTIENLSLERGRASGRSGTTFEQAASQVGKDWGTDFLAERDLFADQSAVLLHKVTLGCARGEFDQMIVSTTDLGKPVHVLAVVEVKKNINDLVHGFRLRQENLAWLVGDRSGYEADLYRTQVYRDGHFTTGTHQEHGRHYHFDRDSFQRFATPDKTGYRLKGLGFITQPRPLLGVTAGELGQILYQISTNPRWNLSTNSGLDKFRRWVLSTISNFQTRDVLRLYASAKELAPQILFND